MQGSGIIDAGAAAAGEIAASPGTLALGRSTGAGWRVNGAFSADEPHDAHAASDARRAHAGRRRGRRRLHASARAASGSRAGNSVLVHLKAITASAPTGSSTADGTVLVAVHGGGGIRLPWAIAFGGADST